MTALGKQLIQAAKEVRTPADIDVKNVHREQKPRRPKTPIR